MTDWAEKVIAVTGGASGMGRETALTLRRRGARVAVLDARLAGSAELAAHGILALQTDVRDETSVARAFSCIDGELGALTGLFSNAGVTGQESLLHIQTTESWDEVMAVNLRGTFLVLREGVRRLLRGGGAIVCTSSAMGGLAIPGGTNAYTASKGAINALVRQVAVDYARSGIRINAVAPGAIDTPLMWETTPPNQLATMRTTIDGEVPLGRIGVPADVAEAVAWLLSDEAAYVTGAVYLVDGGVSAQMVLSV